MGHLALYTAKDLAELNGFDRPTEDFKRSRFDSARRRFQRTRREWPLCTLTGAEIIVVDWADPSSDRNALALVCPKCSVPG